ncbi:MAG: peptidoglycan DD-metalloendopeptidase family protein, partial [Bacillota bacterium]
MRTAVASLALLACVAAPCARALTIVAERVVAADEAPSDRITDEQRSRIWQAIDRARATLSLPKAGAHPLFQWPLRSARGYSAPGFYEIVNYIDHDPTYPNHVRDYNCGTRTYDLASGYNHQGTDISLWPDNWNVMAARQVEIVAAAPGTVVYKSDGNFDQNCAFLPDVDWNAVYVQHDDGSIAWYGHMKKGSPTSKAIGERVATGEYLGTVGSSGMSTGPHLHFEVYDAANRLIDPWQGQCNPSTSDSWWANQQPYRVSQINRAITASAAPDFGTCGADGHMSNAGTLAVKRSFARGETVYAVTFLRDLLTGQSVTFRFTSPDGTTQVLHGSASTQDYSAAYWYVTMTFDAGDALGTWLFEGELQGTTAEAPFDLTADGQPLANYTDLWWNAAESGWGVNVIHQGATLFATWFTYDTDGSGMWLVMSNALRQPDGSYSGPIYRTTGVPFSQINGQAAANFPPPTVGTGTFRFASPQQGTFSYVVNGVSQQKAITRQGFSTPATCAFTTGNRTSLTNYQDLWWNASEPGWGVNLAHQGDILFATWFTYGSGGKGQWLVGSNVARGPMGDFSGTLYRTTGTPFNLINGTPAVTSGLANAGQVTFTFSDGEHGRMNYTVDGVTQSKAIT